MNKDIPWRFIISHLKGDVDEKEEKLFCEWLQEERNTLLFRELESLWREIREETSTYTPDTDYYWRQKTARSRRTFMKSSAAGMPRRPERNSLIFMPTFRRMKSRNLCHCGSFGWRYL